MSGRYVYLDTSAFARQVMTEPESGALIRFLRTRPLHATATLLRTEVLRAAMRVSQRHVALARPQLANLAFIELSRPCSTRPARSLRPGSNPWTPSMSRPRPRWATTWPSS